MSRTASSTAASNTALRSFGAERLLLLAPLLFVPATAGASPPQGAPGGGLQCTNGDTVEILRDTYGVPHIYADSDEAAFFGLGFACAQDRYFQMTYTRLQMEGRTAEFFGVGDESEYLAWDQRVRTYGYTHLASRLFDGMDAEAKGLLQAYAAGVNHYAATATEFHCFFDQLGIPTNEPWTPQASILAWLRIGKKVGATEANANEIERMESYLECVADRCAGMSAEECHETCLVEALGGEVIYDEFAAVVQESDIDPDVHDDIFAYAEAMGLIDPNGVMIPRTLLLEPGVTMSEAWATNECLTGNAALYGGPKVSVRIPNDLWEAHVVGSSFNARGACFPGSPNLMFGSTEFVAWSGTSLGMDQVDLFEIDEVDDDHYRVIDLQGNTIIEPYVRITEPILVSGTPFMDWEYKATEEFGPIVTAYVGGDPGHQYAALSVPFYEGIEPTRGFLDMYRSTTAEGFLSALAGWTYVDLNVVFATSEGSCGYAMAGSLPLRNPETAVLGGSGVQDGSTLESLWIDIVPHELKPWVIDPARGFTYSANHLPVGSWYPIPLSRYGGFTYRAWRVYESLVALGAPDCGNPPGSPEDVRDVQRDTTLSHARDFARLGLHLRDVQQYPFTSDQLLVLAQLEDWIAPDPGAGAQLRRTHPLSSAVAARVPQTVTLPDPLSEVYGLKRTEYAIAWFLRDSVELVKNGGALNADAAGYVQSAIQQTWFLLNKPANLPGSACPECWEDWYLDPDYSNDGASCGGSACSGNGNKQASYSWGRVEHWKSIFAQDLPGLCVCNPAEETCGDEDPPPPCVCCGAGQVACPFPQLYGPIDGAYPTLMQQFNMWYSQFAAMGPDPEARTLLWYGESEDMRSEHFDDQLPIWEQGRDAVFKPQLYQRPDVLALGATVDVTLCYAP